MNHGKQSTIKDKTGKSSTLAYNHLSLPMKNIYSNESNSFYMINTVLGTGIWKKQVVDPTFKDMNSDLQ